MRQPHSFQSATQGS